MTKLDVGQIITILANMGVIAGIVFLAVEVSQNNDQLASQTRNTIYQMQAELQADYFNNTGGLADLYTKQRRGEQLTETEATRLGSRRSHVLRTLEYMFREDPEYTMESTDFAIAVFRGDPGLRAAWESSKADKDVDFVRWFERFVLPRLEQ